jgi:type II secretory pathway component PulF
MNNTKNSFSITDQIFFAQRLSLLLASDISLTQSLSVMMSMDNSLKRKKIYEYLIRSCERGISLSKSMIDSKVKFDQLLITLIKNGEHSGTLIESLSEIVSNLEKRNELKKKIITTLIYPAFIFFATICMSLFLVMYIFPKILPMLNSMNIDLPFLTLLIKALYEYSILYGLQVIGFIVFISITFFILIKRYTYFRYYLHKILLKIPIYSTYLKLSILSSLCSIGEILLSSGRSVSEFHTFSIDSLKNIIYINSIKEIHKESVQGISFSNSMSKYPDIFFQIMIDMCSIGEKTGNLALMLGHCSKILEQDLDNLLKRFSALIEPILMIFMGIVVGSIALSIILPVYEITNHLTK